MALAEDINCRKVLLRLSLDCNNRCLFCNNDPRRSPENNLKTDEVKKRILESAGTGAEMVVFSGGEPTIRQDIIPLCEYAGRLGLSSGIITNGRMLSYQAFTEDLVAAGLRYALISLHAAEAEAHNRLTGAAGFRQTLKGLGNLSAHPVRIVVNSVLTKLNYGGLAKMARLLGGFAPLAFKISLPEPKGNLLGNLDLVLPPGEAARAANAFMEKTALPPGLAIGFDGFTPCLLDNYFAARSDFFTQGFIAVRDPGEGGFFAPDHGDRTFTDSCYSCSFLHLCPGVYTKYVQMFPAMNLRPFRELVSNGIRFDLHSKHPVKPGKRPCPPLDHVGGEPARWLSVKKGNSVLLYRTCEYFTTVPELLRAKREIEQVYHCDTNVTENLHFPTHLKKMELLEECRACPRRFGCPGLFVKAKKQPFAPAVSHIRSLLKTLHGAVCEIGCGDSPFFDDMKNSIRKGDISFYLGLDPALPVKAAEEAGGKFLLRRCGLEDFRWDGGPFDFAVLFRSYHHLNDLDLSMKSLLAITKPGSRVILTEDCRHLELHDDPMPAGNPAGPPFQHFRNHGAEDAARKLLEYGFETERIVPVGRTSAGLWSLIAVRR